MWYKIRFTIGVLIAVIFVLKMHHIYQKPQITPASDDSKMTKILADNQSNTNIKWY